MSKGNWSTYNCETEQLYFISSLIVFEFNKALLAHSCVQFSTTDLQIIQLFDHVHVFELFRFVGEAFQQRQL